MITVISDRKGGPMLLYLYFFCEAEAFKRGTGSCASAYWGDGLTNRIEEARAAPPRGHIVELQVA